MQYNIWLIYCLGAPGQVIILLISRLGYLKRKGHQKIEKDFYDQYTKMGVDKFIERAKINAAK